MAVFAGTDILLADGSAVKVETKPVGKIAKTRLTTSKIISVKQVVSIKKSVSKYSFETAGHQGIRGGIVEVTSSTKLWWRLNSGSGTGSYKAANLINEGEQIWTFGGLGIGSGPSPGWDVLIRKKVDEVTVIGVFTRFFAVQLFSGQGFYANGIFVGAD